MDHPAVLDAFRASGALLEGHFILSSGLHSPQYLQCARVLQNPARANQLCNALAELIPSDIRSSIDLVVSPAMGGVVVGYEMARVLGVEAIFSERVEGRFVLRRGFAIRPGARVLMVEDVVTTGLSSRECIECIREAGGEVIAAACLVDRSNGSADTGVPLWPLLRLAVPTYAANQLPPALAALPAIKPGSRHLASPGTTS